jgi:exosortase
MSIAETFQKFKVQFVGLALLLLAVYSSILPPMVRQWYHDDNYSHGFLVPLVAAYFAYERRDFLKRALVSPWGPGLLVLVAGIVQLVFGFLATEYFTMRSSLIVVLIGLTLYLLGREVFRHLLLPLGYLIFMVPLPYIVYDAVAFPLKVLVSKASVWFMQLIGISVIREGNIIMFPTTTLEVADACSGIRSLVSLLALAVAYAFFLKTTAAWRWVIILSAVPIAICTNALRVVATGILAQYWGAQAAEGFFHEFAGLTVFGLAMLMLAGIGALSGGTRR